MTFDLWPLTLSGCGSVGSEEARDTSQRKSLTTSLPVTAATPTAVWPQTTKEAAVVCVTRSHPGTRCSLVFISTKVERTAHTDDEQSESLTTVKHVKPFVRLGHAPSALQLVETTIAHTLSSYWSIWNSLRAEVPPVWSHEKWTGPPEGGQRPARETPHTGSKGTVPSE